MQSETQNFPGCEMFVMWENFVICYAAETESLEKRPLGQIELR